MNHSTIKRIREELISHGMPAAVEMAKSYFPLLEPHEFVAFILGKTAKVRK